MLLLWLHIWCSWIWTDSQRTTDNEPQKVLAKVYLALIEKLEDWCLAYHIPGSHHGAQTLCTFVFGFCFPCLHRAILVQIWRFLCKSVGCQEICTIYLITAAHCLLIVCFPSAELTKVVFSIRITRNVIYYSWFIWFSLCCSCLSQYIICAKLDGTALGEWEIMTQPTTVLSMLFLTHHNSDDILLYSCGKFNRKSISLYWAELPPYSLGSNAESRHNPTSTRQ